jgi:hypothetical protein
VLLPWNSILNCLDFFTVAVRFRNFFLIWCHLDAIIVCTRINLSISCKFLTCWISSLHCHNWWQIHLQLKTCDKFCIPCSDCWHATLSCGES